MYPRGNQRDRHWILSEANGSVAEKIMGICSRARSVRNGFNAAASQPQTTPNILGPTSTHQCFMFKKEFYAVPQMINISLKSVDFSFLPWIANELVVVGHGAYE